MRVFLAKRDNLFIEDYLKKKSFELVDIKYNHVLDIPIILKQNKIDIIIQIAPQWEWGKYIEVISLEIIKYGIKLLVGEGAMFRFFGEDFQCGSDIGFYLAPWGYSGHSKIASILPFPKLSDLNLAKEFIENTSQWDAHNNNNKLLVIGQIDYDRSRMYTRKLKGNHDLLEFIINRISKKNVVFRPHPLDKMNYKSKYGIAVENSGKDLIKIICQYKSAVSLNSTSAIEGMLSGIPFCNLEDSPFKACKSLYYDFDDLWNGNRDCNVNLNNRINDIASLINLHYIAHLNYGEVIENALVFYSNADRNLFNYDCINSNFEPQVWCESFRDLNKN